LINTTTAPASSSYTAVAVTITALGPQTGGMYTTIVVSGLTSSMLQQSGGTMGIQIGTSTYVVNQATLAPNGQVALTILSGVSAQSVYVGESAEVYFPSGSYVPSTSTSSSPSTSPIDPTTHPVSP
jgi:hypothetical protein